MWEAEEKEPERRQYVKNSQTLVFKMERGGHKLGSAPSL